MKTFNQVAAQGDIYIRKIDKLPPKAQIQNTNQKYVIVTHSETGHHHVMDAKAVTMYKLPDSIMDCLLVVNSPTTLEHLREFDTHEPILFNPGTYHVRRQREHTPEGWRQVQD